MSHALSVAPGLFFLAVSFAAYPAAAAWPHDPNNGNVALCTSPGSQGSPAIVSDGAGGAIVAWQDKRTVFRTDIYAQRVTAAGVPVWTANGVALCTANENQDMAQIASDGKGGAIVTWHDSRSGTLDIYAQRVNSAGVPQWTADGVALCTATLDQRDPTIAADGAGGAIVSWTDLRNGRSDVYAQRVNTDGIIQWVENGLGIATAAEDQSLPKIVSDGSGGGIITWYDGRNGRDADIYAQRISTAGIPQWTAGGVPLCIVPYKQFYPTIASDGAGGAIVTWADFRNEEYDIYAQRVSSEGVPQWTPNGVAVCTAADTQHFPEIASDGAGGAIVTWKDSRSGTNDDVYAQRVDGSGVLRWTENGVALCTAARTQDFPVVVPDGAGGGIVAWRDGRVDLRAHVYAQEISADGTTQWAANGLAVCTAASQQGIPVATSDSLGVVILAWTDTRNGNDDIYAQRIGPFGKLGSPEPTLTSVLDVPKDQGGLVQLTWDASYLDLESDPDLAIYDIFRSVPLGWELVSTVEAQHLIASYSANVATIRDSLADSNPSASFKVVGRNSTGSKYWRSAPDSGYSVDNLPPTTPASFTGQYAAGTTHLHWDRNVEADLDGYWLYRGLTAEFLPGQDNFVGALPDTGYADVAGSPYIYKLTAVDVHGNESPIATLIPSGTVGVGDASSFALSFAAPNPNPARGATTLEYTLPRPGHVRLSIYDAAGRRVQVLRDGELAAGAHRERFALRDDAGRELASGLYLVRLEAEGRVITRRFAAIR